MNNDQNKLRCKAQNLKESVGSSFWQKLCQKDMLRKDSFLGTKIKWSLKFSIIKRRNTGLRNEKETEVEHYSDTKIDIDM